MKEWEGIFAFRFYATVAVLIVCSGTAGLTQVPDFPFPITPATEPPTYWDSIIVECKTVGPNNLPLSLFVRVNFSNKDTLAYIGVALKETTTVGNAYAILARPRDEVQDNGAGSFNILLPPQQLEVRAGYYRYHSNSPDTLAWSGLTVAGYSDGCNACFVPPGATRPLLDVKFDTVKGSGQFELDSGRISGTEIRTAFITKRAAELNVNFVKGVITVSSEPIRISNCPCDSPAPHGRAFSYDFEATAPGTWSMVSGPGSINSSTGVYNFNGQCTIGSVPVAVRVTDASSNTYTCNFSISVINRAPTCSATQDTVTVPHGTTATNQINSFDPDPGDLLFASMLSGPGTVTSGGAWSRLTSCSDVSASPQAIKIIVRDSFPGCSDRQDDTCQFTLRVTNALPRITCPLNATIRPGMAYVGQASATDTDPGDAGGLTFAKHFSTQAAGLTVSASGRVEWTPTAADTGKKEVVIEVRDRCGLTATCQYFITVDLRIGDLNLDGSLSAADVVLMLLCVINGESPSAEKPACDVHCRDCTDPACNERCRGQCHELTRQDIDFELITVFQALPFPPC